jgi:hypothetical protein
MLERVGVIVNGRLGWDYCLKGDRGFNRFGGVAGYVRDEDDYCFQGQSMMLNFGKKSTSGDGNSLGIQENHVCCATLRIEKTRRSVGIQICGSSG